MADARVRSTDPERRILYVPAFVRAAAVACERNKVSESLDQPALTAAGPDGNTGGACLPTLRRRGGGGEGPWTRVSKTGSRVQGLARVLQHVCCCVCLARVLAPGREQVRPLASWNQAAVCGHVPGVALHRVATNRAQECPCDRPRIVRDWPRSVPS